MTDRGDRVLLHCFAGCPVRKVVAALSLQMRDLFAHAGGIGRIYQATRIEAVYDYRDLTGVIQYQKVRFCPKSFRMRVPDTRAPGGYRWKLGDIELILYRWPDLIDCRRVLVVEGEKAVDRLRAIGLKATCGPNGASRWLPSYRAALWRAGCAEVVILQDHDRPGQRFANSVAASCDGYRPEPDALADLRAPLTAEDLLDAEYAPLTVKIVRLPGLNAHEDVVDWLDRGGTQKALLALIDGTPRWSPEAEGRARANRRRALGAERVRRWRAKHRQD